MADKGQQRRPKPHRWSGWLGSRPRPRALGKRPPRRRAWPSALGWILAGVAVAGYLVNELTVDIPLVHYGMFAVLFVGVWLGLRSLR